MSRPDPPLNATFVISHARTHSLTTHSLTHALTHSLTHALTHSLTHTLTHTFTHHTHTLLGLLFQLSWWLEGVGAPRYSFTLVVLLSVFETYVWFFGSEMDIKEPPKRILTD